MNRSDAPFHVVTIDWGEATVANVCDRIEARSGVRFTHVVSSDRTLADFDRGRGRRGVHWLRDHPAFRQLAVDRARLDALERPGLMTVHNMILSDRVLRHLPADDALAFATAMAAAFADVFDRLKPDAIIGSFDNLHACLSLAVARSLGIPWFALSFTPLPSGLTGFCAGMSPNAIVGVLERSDAELRRLAEDTLSAFEARTTVVPIYRSAISLSMVARKLPAHVRAFAAQLRRFVTGRFDRYTEYPPAWLARQYVRKRFNTLTMPTRWLIDTPPDGPYVFYGLGMQPESSIDVWAPFYMNQFTVVEALVRSAPPSCPVVVKLHAADADSYSRRDLRRLLRLPGVRLASPFAPSRPFIERAAVVTTIMGTMAMEAALLGKPVLMFGESQVSLMPSVSHVPSVTDLPRLIRAKLAEPRPSREALVRGLMSYLSLYAPGCYNDWSVRPTEDEVGHFVALFGALRTHLHASEGTPRCHDTAC